MSVIIRLQNLPWSANASDIREFFVGQSIPEGGVHIVGGELGDAFIAFSTDEDARLAMRKTGTALKGIQISLLLSSRAEMQKVIEAARQQALGMQTYIAPPSSIPQQVPQSFQQQSALPAGIPNLPQQAPLQIPMQGNSQSPLQGLPTQIGSSHVPLPGTPQQILQPNFQQTPIMQSSFPELSDTGASGIAYTEQQMAQQRSYNQQTYGSQVPQYAYQRPPTNFHPGVISPNVNANQYYGQPPAMSSGSVGVVVPSHLQNSPEVGDGSPSNNSPAVLAGVVQQGTKVPQTSNASIPVPQGAPDKVDKRSSSISSKDGRDKRDSKGRDERRRHSKSRSRSRDRDRRRRHRSRSRSRSRDRSGRRRRSRSKERERKERDNKEKDRLRDKDRNRPLRDRNERGSYDGSKLVRADGEGGIPGLGEIPDDIPKEGLSIFSSATATSQSQGPITSTNEWPQRETKDETEIQDVTMEDVSPPEEIRNGPFPNFDQTTPSLPLSGFMGAIPSASSFQNSPAFVENRDQLPQMNVREPPKVWDQPPVDPRRIRNDLQQPSDHFVDPNSAPLRTNDMVQLPHPSDAGWNRPPLGRNEWSGPRSEQWNSVNNNPQVGVWNVQQENDRWNNPAFARGDERNMPLLNRSDDKNLAPFIPDGMRGGPGFSNAEGDRNRLPFDKSLDSAKSSHDDRNNSPLIKEEDRNRPLMSRNGRNQLLLDNENIRNQPPLLTLHGHEEPIRGPSNERNDWKRSRNEEWNDPNRSSLDGDRWNRQPRIDKWEKSPYGRDERGKPPFNRDDRNSGLLPFAPDGTRGRLPFAPEDDRNRHPFSKERRSPSDKVGDKNRSPHNDRSGSSIPKEEDRIRPPLIRNKPSPRRDEPHRVPPLMGDDYEMINSPSSNGPEGDDKNMPHRDNRGYEHQNRDGPWYNENKEFPSAHTMRTPSFSGSGENFGSFHNGRRGGFGGRDGGRDISGPGFRDRDGSRDSSGRGFRDRDVGRGMPDYSDRDGGRDGPGFREREGHFRGRHENDSGFRGRGRGNFMRGGRMGGSEYSHRDRNYNSTCIEVLHLSPTVKHKDIKEYFEGARLMVPISAIKLIGDKHTKTPLGVALLKFSSSRDAYEATKLSGTFIHNSRVEINIIEEGLYSDMKDISEMTGTVSSSPSMPPLMESQNAKISSDILYVKGLPVGCTDHDVSKVFEKFKVEEIVLELEKGSRQPSGGCFVRLNTPAEAAFALEKLINPHIDGTPIKIDSCSQEDMDVAKKEREKINVPKPAVKPIQSTPSNLNKSEKKRPDAKSLNSSSAKMPRDILDAQKSLGSLPKPSPKITTKTKSETDEQPANNDLLTDSIELKNVSPDVTEVCIRDFFSDEGLIPEKIYFNKPDSEGKTDVFVVFPKISSARKALLKSNQLLGGVAVTINLINKPAVMMAMGLPFNPLELFKKGQEANGKEEPKKPDLPVKKPLLQVPKSLAGGMSKPVAYSPRAPANQPKQPVKVAEPPPDFGKPGCVIALSNVPFSATTEDILEFFKEFSSIVRPENIIRRYDELNRPTADARVAFPNSNLSEQAVKKLDRKLMMNRPISLCIVK